MKLKNIIKKIILLINKKLSKSENPQNIYIYKKQVNQKLKLTHIAAFTYANAGDTLLPVTVKDSLNMNSEKDYYWNNVHVHSTITDKTIEVLNKKNGIIIGGGGLFLSDTNPNNLSGWQWSCSIENLKKIKIPIALFAVGYNRFRGQEDFSPLFRDHVNILVDKSPFIGLRNHGSIENFKNYIDLKNHHKIKFQPCPTTIISHLYPELTKKANNNKPFIALNCAFDRSILRYGEQIGERLSSIVKAIKKLSIDFDIKYYSHCTPDNYFLPFLDSYGVKYELVQLNLHPIKIIEHYSKPALAIGMRGHSQMIPFGCKTSILSIISHEKMRYFIEDISHPEWGVDINDPNFEDELYNKAIYILSNQDTIKSKIDIAQKKLFDITNNNVAFIKEKFNI